MVENAWVGDSPTRRCKVTNIIYGEYYHGNEYKSMWL